MEKNVLITILLLDILYFVKALQFTKLTSGATIGSELQFENAVR